MSQIICIGVRNLIKIKNNTYIYIIIMHLQHLQSNSITTLVIFPTICCNKWRSSLVEWLPTEFD